MFKFGKKKGAKEGEDQAADVPAVADGSAAEGEEGAAPKKKKLPLLFIVIPVALLVMITAPKRRAVMTRRPTKKAVTMVPLPVLRMAHWA
jgi:hypothetical protein